MSLQAGQTIGGPEYAIEYDFLGFLLRGVGI